MKQLLMVLVMGLGIIGCTTPKDFNSSIKAYDSHKSLDYLKHANEFAKTDQEKAILEKKFVDYMGVDKVFDIQVNNGKGKVDTVTYSALISKLKASTQRINIKVTAKPKENLPFVLKYNTYKIPVAVKEYIKLKKTPVYHSKITYKEVEKEIAMRTLILSPSNNWRDSSTGKSKIIVYGEGIDAYWGKMKFKVVELNYTFLDAETRKKDADQKRNDMIMHEISKRIN